MRRGVCLLIASGLLALPASALATDTIAVGDVAGDTSAGNSITFDLHGKVNKKGNFVWREVSGFDVTIDFNCWDASGNLLSTTRRSDLPFGLMNAGQIGRKGNFHVAYLPEGDAPSAAVIGMLRKRKTFSGLIGSTQGPTEGAHCSTGTFTNASISWKARIIRPVCGATTDAGPMAFRRCAAPRP